MEVLSRSTNTIGPRAAATPPVLLGPSELARGVEGFVAQLLISSSNSPVGVSASSEYRGLAQAGELLEPVGADQRARRTTAFVHPTRITPGCSKPRAASPTLNPSSRFDGLTRRT